MSPVFFRLISLYNMDFLALESSLDHFIGLVIKRADFHTDRAAIILVKIRKTNLIINISHLAVIMFNRVVIKSSRGAFILAYPAVFAVLSNPAVWIRLTFRQILNAGEYSS